MVVPRLAVPVGTAARSGHPVRLGVSDGPGGRCVFLRAGLPGDQVQLSARRQTQGQVVFPPSETLACLSRPCAIRRARSEDGQRHDGDQGSVTDWGVRALYQSSVIGGMLVVMIVVNWRLALVVLGSIPVLFIALARLNQKLRASISRQRKQEGRIASRMNEVLGEIGRAHV